MAAGDTQITIAGNLVDDPELRFTPSGQPVAKFRVASTPRFLDKNTNEWKDGDSLFLTCNVWRQAAENVAESLTRGTRVIVSGRLRQRSYETKEGEKRTVYEVEVDDVGPSLRNASAKVNKMARNGSGGPGGPGGPGGGGGGRSSGGQGGGGGRAGGRLRSVGVRQRQLQRRAPVLTGAGRAPVLTGAKSHRRTGAAVRWPNGGGLPRSRPGWPPGPRRPGGTAAPRTGPAARPVRPPRFPRRSRPPRPAGRPGRRPGRAARPARPSPLPG